MRLSSSRRNVLKGGAATLATVAFPRASPQALLTRINGSGVSGGVPAITGASTGVTNATVNWSAPATGTVIGYQVSRDGVDSSGTGAWTGHVGPALRAKTFTRLIPGSTYNLGVAAVTANGVGPVVTTRVLLPHAAPQGMAGAWTVTASGPALTAVAGRLSAPLVLEVDADLGDSALWLADPGTTPPGEAQTAVSGKSRTAGRHVYGLQWTTTSIRVYMDGVSVASVPIVMKAESKALAVVGTPIRVYRASVFDPV